MSVPGSLKARGFFLLTLGVVLANALWANQNSVDSAVDFESHSRTFFQRHCTDSHGEDKQKANLTLHDIEFDVSSADVGQRWRAVLRQLETSEMPPKKREQPSSAERESLIAGIKAQFRRVGHPIERLRADPKYGNYVDHAALFSGEHKGPAFSRPRIWRISPYIDGQSSPFSLSQEEGFKDYAHMWSVDKPTIELLLLKASAAVKKQIGPSEAELRQQDEIWKKQILAKRRSLRVDVEKQKKLVAEKPDNAGAEKRLQNLTRQLERNEATDFEKDRKRPSNQLGRLRKSVRWRIAYGNEMPSQDELESAVEGQLKTALRRKPTVDEVTKMAMRLKESIAAHGNETGISIVLTSILLLPESIYRLELGWGEELPDGRRMLSQDEIAYALGYALTDGGPDKELLKD
ncbi:MAG: hypothetical protein AAF517_06425, partial [Planctomycetota bacterium]